MKTRNESIEKLRDLVDVQLKRFQVTIKHYHADGAAELIDKQVVQILKREGATYSWNPAETPELMQQQSASLGRSGKERYACY